MGLLALLYRLFQALQMGEAMRVEIADDRCVACSSKDLINLGPNAYECRACGYSGGSGLAQMQQQHRQDAWAAWSPEKRRAGAIKDLKHARSLLISVEGTLAGASGEATLDLIGMGGSADGEANPKRRAMTEASGLIAEAQAAIRDAKAKATHVGETSEVKDSSFFSEVFDVQMDNLFSDLTSFKQIGALKRSAVEARGVVEGALERLG
ncbi:MAG: hypothetical protein AB8H79_22315 [Myxococcota bacterium]